MTHFDLHSHSTASDGTLTPTELVRHAHDAGVGTLALTDHDTTEGVSEARRAAARLDMGLIAGVEISVTWSGQTVHIVGLNLDTKHARLEEGLAGLRQFRDWRARAIGRRLENASIPGAYEGALALSNGHLVSRTHFARFLVANGHAKDVRDVFKRYLVNGKPGHVAGEWARLNDAVDWIREAGGQAVIAHPARYRMTRTKLHKLIKMFRDAGGEALEVVSGSHSRDETYTMARHAKDFGLLCSAGSDYHGPENPWIEMGCLDALPPGCKPIWYDWSPVAKVR